MKRKESERDAGHSFNPQLAAVRLYAILDLAYVHEREAHGVATALLEGGAGILQLRAKNRTSATIATLARMLAPLCRSFRAPLIINDHPELVRETGADGAHVGQDDMSVAEARALAGPEAMIGKSTHSLTQALAANDESPDYIGFGPLFATATKPDYQPIGLDEIAEAHSRLALPIFCIGGIKRENLPAVLTAGAKRVVIVSGILQASDPAAYCRECATLLRTER